MTWTPHPPFRRLGIPAGERLHEEGGLRGLLLLLLLAALLLSLLHLTAHALGPLPAAPAAAILPSGLLRRRRRRVGFGRLAAPLGGRVVGGLEDLGGLFLDELVYEARV